MSFFGRLLREPLFHFFVGGGLIFALHAVGSGPTRGGTDEIFVGSERIERLEREFEAAWRRPPAEAELRALVDEHVREEVYYREALALGLDRGDTIIRRRLRQKMEFLANTGAELIEPVPGELEAHLAEHEARFRREPRVGFEQVFLGEGAEPVVIEPALRALRAAADPSSIGVRTLLPPRLDLEPATRVDATFGRGFFERLAGAPTGEWAGPIRSSYGVHLVRIDERQPGRTPPVEEIHEAVFQDWRAAKAEQLREMHYERLQDRYVIEIDEAALAREAP